MLHRDHNVPVEGGHRCESYRLVADEECNLPFPDGTFDLVMSSQAMQWINDLPKLFKEVKVIENFPTRFSQGHGQISLPVAFH